MKSQEMMTGYWYTLFSQILNPTEINVDTNNFNIDKIAVCFNQEKSYMEDSFGGNFDSQESVNFTRFNYIQFPDLFVHNESNGIYFTPDEIQNGYDGVEAQELNELFNEITTVRIDINPCIPLLKENKKITSKIYVIVWHAGDFQTEKLNKFYKISQRVASVIAIKIQSLYLKCIEDIVGIYEKQINNKLITNVFFNEEIKNNYYTILDRIKKDGTIEFELMEKMWKPVMDYSSNIFVRPKRLDDFRLFTQKLYSDKLGKEITGIYGLTSGFGKNGNSNSEITQIIGITPYPHDVTLEVQIPIIQKT